MIPRFAQTAARQFDNQSNKTSNVLPISTAPLGYQRLMVRRRFMGGLIKLLGCLSLLGSGVIAVAAKPLSRILPADTDLSNLLYEDPAYLDGHQLPISTINQFGIGGTDDHHVDMQTWQLQFAGMIERPFSLSYAQLLQLPPLERKVLLICPGTFAYVANWQGFSLWDLLRQNGISAQATHVDILGPPEKYRKTARFSLNEVEKDRIFLATRVNGHSLPLQHGFPLRLVAKGHIGADWIKYVYRIEAVRDNETETDKAKSKGPAFFP